jgi:hypothetical protein
LLDRKFASQASGPAEPLQPVRFFLLNIACSRRLQAERIAAI